MIRRMAGLGAVVLTVGLLAPAADGAGTALTGGEKWRESGTVVRILDGDTFDMKSKGEVVRVRINGIQAPEKTWCGGSEATAALKAALPVGTKVRLASRKEASGNAPTGTWRLKRTVFVKQKGTWTNVAPDLLARGLVFPFPFIGESAHNDEYLATAWIASQQAVGLYDPTFCGRSPAPDSRLRLQVVSDGPGKDTADSEFVVVYNGSDTDIDISAWMVQDTSPLNAYFFPKKAKLGARDYVVVFSGKGKNGVAPDGSKNKRFFYADLGQRWNNRTTDIAFLFDDAGKDKTGNLRSWLIVPPTA